jgi:large conductance mechanosensitive channel
MPPIGKMMGGVDFSQLIVALSGDGHSSLAEATAANAPVIAYGSFIQTTIDFVIVAFVIFIAVKIFNNMKKKEEATPSAPPADIALLTEIRDALRK